MELFGKKTADFRQSQRSIITDKNYMGVFRLRIESFFQELKDAKKTVAFIGVGVSNNDCIKLFLKHGIKTQVRDRRSDIGEIAGEFRALGAELILGEDYMEDIDADVIVRAPGVFYNSPAIKKAREQGKVVTSEMELFFSLCPCKIIAITGSDGKTTTSAVTAEMLKKAGKTVWLGGNIGKALLPEIEKIKEEDYAVVELSSFQLESMRSSPHIAAVKNVEPNHLDVHGTMEEYIGAKLNILSHQDAFSRAVLNADNEVTRDMAKLVRGELKWFSTSGKTVRGTLLDEDGYLCSCDGVSKTRIFHRSEIKLPGLHNVDNYLTAMAILEGIVSGEDMLAVAREFGGVEHRIEFVRELDGVRWYNDSIASNPTRVIAGLRSFGRKIAIIAGGYDKKIPYEPMAPVVCEYVKLLILMGATADKIEAAVKSHPDFNADEMKIIRVSGMEEAVKAARENTVEGDIVSLSPASASFDLYRNFEERGRHFKSIVMQLS